MIQIASMLILAVGMMAVLHLAVFFVKIKPRPLAVCFIVLYTLLLGAIYDYLLAFAEYRLDWPMGIDYCFVSPPEDIFGIIFFISGFICSTVYFISLIGLCFLKDWARKLILFITPFLLISYYFLIPNLPYLGYFPQPHTMISSLGLTFESQFSISLYWAAAIYLFIYLMRPGIKSQFK